MTARNGGTGQLTIRLPELEPEEPGQLSATALAAASKPDPWMVPRRAPAGSAPDRVRLHEATERFRAQIDRARKDRVSDHCRWQTGLMRFLANNRDAVTDEEVMPTASTRRILTQVAESIRLVEELRTSSDPMLAGPTPGIPASGKSGWPCAASESRRWRRR